MSIPWYVVLVSGTRNHAQCNQGAIWSRLNHHAGLASVQKRRLVIVEGAATGVDTIAYEWAKRTHAFTSRDAAPWVPDGSNPKAGTERNALMLAMVLGMHLQGHVCTVEAFPTKDSRGTRNMIALVLKSAIADRLTVTEM